MENQESKFDGSFWAFVGWSILGVLVCIITLGIAFPWVCCWIIRWRTNNTVIEGRRLQFNGSGLSLFGHFILRGWLLGIILTPLTLGLYPIYYFNVSLKKWEIKNTTFADTQNNSNISQTNLGQSNFKSNYLIISIIIGAVVILFNIVFSIIFGVKVGFSFRMLINIPFVFGLIGVVLIIIAWVGNVKILPIIAGILFSVSSIYTIISLIRLASTRHFYGFMIFNFISLLLIIPAILSFLEFIKNRNNNL